MNSGQMMILFFKIMTCRNDDDTEFLLIDDELSMFGN